MRRVLTVTALCLALAGGARAQEARPILTINQERLFEDSLFGQRLQAEIEAAYQELAAENRRMEAELEAEERRLTELRPTLPAEEFRPLAEAFDQRVTEIRRTQDAKSREISARTELGYQSFVGAALPILAAIMDDLGAEVILDSRTVFLSSDRLDITAEALARIDATLGSGEAEAAPDGTVAPRDQGEEAGPGAVPDQGRIPGAMPAPGLPDADPAPLPGPHVVPPQR
ncbi:OmpH family outer membrane protein [Plastorhodobacter daqingensis]|uniref:OmpH family outer membrane protein n=1 Tax=Plastorhodobacter daqingensis TaxID=1387281 RepID=A0ABW2UI94_9RHOB